MGLWQVVFVVFMIIWLLFGGWYGSTAPEADRFGRFGLSFIPWARVAILGAMFLGGLPAH